MDKITLILEKYIEPAIGKFDDNKVMVSLKAGSIFTTPFLILGGFVSVIIYFPGLEKIFPSFFQWAVENLSIVEECTFGLSAIMMLLGVSSSYAKEYKVNTIYATITAFLCFLMITIFKDTQSIMVDGVLHEVTVSNVIPVSAFGFRGIIVAILVSLLSVRIYAYLTHHKVAIKMPESIPPNTFNAFSAIVPAAGTILVFLIIRNIFLNSPYESVTNFIYQIITTPLLGVGNNIFSFIFVTQICGNILWFFGVHGTNVVNTIWNPILQTMTMANITAFKAGETLPFIVSNTFNTVYGITGVYVIVISLLLVAKSQRMRKVTKMSVVPAIFCISEPMVFGVPIFMNPILFIPYLICSSVQFLVAYVLCYIDFAPVPVIPIPWTTPIFINALLSTNWNWMGVVTQVILLVVGVLIWVPFIKILDKKYIDEESKISEQILIDKE